MHYLSVVHAVDVLPMKITERNVEKELQKIWFILLNQIVNNIVNYIFLLAIFIVILLCNVKIIISCQFSKKEK